MGYDSMYGGYSTHILPTRNSESDRDVPKYVQELAEKIEDKGNEPSYAWPVAWSVWCRYKKPGSPHCTRKPKEYFKDRKALTRRIASSYLIAQRYSSPE